MEITQTLVNLTASIKREVSYIANRSYSEDGTSLYDAIRYVSRDDSVINDAIKSAVATVEQSLCRFGKNNASTTDAYRFNIAGARRAFANESMLSQYVADAVFKLSVAKYLRLKGIEVEAQKYEEAASGDIILIQKTIYSKSAPTM